MLLGFSGLGFADYRRSRRVTLAPARKDGPDVNSVGIAECCLLWRAWIDALAVERRTMSALPGNVRLVANLKQEIELLREQLVVIVGFGAE